jgi:type I restriction enzyme S subunit
MSSTNHSERPDSWTSTRLENVVERSRGRRDPQDYPELPYLGLKHIQEETMRLHGKSRSEEYESTSVHFLPGDILYGRLRPYLNKVHLTDFEGLGSGEIIVLTPTEDIHPRYLAYLLNSQEFVRYADHRSTGDRPRVNYDKIKEFELPLPPLAEQQRIVAKIEELFSKLDSGVSELQKGTEMLKQYRLSLLKAAFEGKLSNRARTQNGWEVTQDYEEHGDPPDILDIPSKWRWVEAGSVIDSLRNGIYKPKEYYNDDGIASLRMYNIEDGQIVWKDIKRMDLTDEELEKFRLEPGDLLVNRVNSRELVGKAAVIPEALEECVFESKNIRVKLTEDLRGKYLAHWFYLFRKRYFMSQVKQTVGQATVTQTQIKEMPIPLAPIAEQNKILETIERRESILSGIREQLETNITRAKRLRHSILKWAFEGNLVPQEPTEELSSPDGDDTNVEKEAQMTLTEVTKDVE